MTQEQIKEIKNRIMILRLAVDNEENPLIKAYQRGKLKAYEQIMKMLEE